MWVHDMFKTYIHCIKKMGAASGSEKSNQFKVL